MKQTSLFKKNKSLGKTKRALACRTETHLILGPSIAKGAMSLRSLQYETKVWQIIKRQAKRSGVEILSFVNVGSHLHLIIKFSHRSFYTKFIRAATGLIARLMLKSKKGLKSKTKFFDRPVFTRALKSYRELQTMRRYIFKNEYEAIFGSQARAKLEEAGFFDEEAYQKRDEILGMRAPPEHYFGQMSLI